MVFAPFSKGMIWFVLGQSLRYQCILLYNCINKDEGKQQLKQPVHVLQQCRSETTGPSPDVDLGDLSENQKIAVINMLREEADSFSKNDDDIGCAEGLELKINLSNSRPVLTISLPDQTYR